MSNASWANSGYLVTGEVEGVDTLKELRMRSHLHDTGFIMLDAANPAESQILLPAEEMAGTDWHAANRLAEENKDFRNYIIRLREFYQTGNIRKHDWL